MHQSVAGSWKHACMDLSQRDTPRSLPTSTKSLHNAQDKEHVGTKLAPRLASARSLPKGSGSVDGTLTVVHVASPLLRRLGKRPWPTVPTCSALKPLDKKGRHALALRTSARDNHANNGHSQRCSSPPNITHLSFIPVLTMSLEFQVKIPGTLREKLLMAPAPHLRPGQGR